MGTVSAVLFAASIVATNLSLWILIRRVNSHDEAIRSIDALNTRRSWAIAVLRGKIERLENGDNNDSNVS